jgi:hypothetical protein
MYYIIKPTLTKLPNRLCEWVSGCCLISSEQFYSYYVWHELFKDEMMIISVLYKTNRYMIANSVGCFLFFLTSCLSSPTCLIISFTNQNKEKVNSCPLPLLPYIYILFFIPLNKDFYSRRIWISYFLALSRVARFYATRVVRVSYI